MKTFTKPTPEDRKGYLPDKAIRLRVSQARGYRDEALCGDVGGVKWIDEGMVIGVVVILRNWARVEKVDLSEKELIWNDDKRS